MEKQPDRCSMPNCFKQEDLKYKKGNYSQNVFELCCLCTEHLEQAEKNFKKGFKKRKEAFDKKVQKNVVKIVNEQTKKDPRN